MIPDDDQRRDFDDSTRSADDGLGTATDAVFAPWVMDAADASTPEDARVAELLTHTIDVPVLAEALEQTEAADAADTLESLSDADTLDILEQMGDEAAAEALAAMLVPLAVSVIDDLFAEDKGVYAGRLLRLMAPDDAADILQELDEAERERLLEMLPGRQSARLRTLVGFHPETAGGLMTTDVVRLRPEMDIAVAIEQVRRRRFPRGVDHLLVIDDEDRLIGVVNIRDLLLAESETLIEAIMSRDVAAVRADLDQEAVAEAFDRYDYYMLAVVDETGHLLGIVTVDDVIDIIREEQTEDMQRTVGAGKVEAVYSSVGEKFRGRFPWLLVNLGTVSISAVIVLNFEGLIAQLAILAVIMPVIASQAGNAGHQALAVTLRGIVLGEVRRERVWPLVAREAIVGLIAGIALGVVAALVMVVLGSAGVMEGVSYRLGIVVAAAMAISTAAGTLSGVAIPLAMRTLKADPAMGSAIFLIMVTDAVAFASFLGGANLVAGWLGVTG